jgi:hypothetical protein
MHDEGRAKPDTPRPYGSPCDWMPLGFSAPPSGAWARFIKGMFVERVGLDSSPDNNTDVHFFFST